MAELAVQSRSAWKLIAAAPIVSPCVANFDASNSLVSLVASNGYTYTIGDPSAVTVRTDQGTIIWSQGIVEGTLSFITAQDQDCYVVIIGGAVPGGGAYRAEDAQHPGDQSGQGVWTRSSSGQDQNAAPGRDLVANHLRNVMSNIIRELETLNPAGKKFAKADLPKLSNVTTEAYVLESTDVNEETEDLPFPPIERAALVMTQVRDRHMPPNMNADMFRAQGKSTTGVGVPPQGATFSVVHLSVMVHPRSPHAASAHGNWRYFEVRDSKNKVTNWWFGGAANLMPALLYDEDVQEFHRVIKSYANKHGEDSYDGMKAWCDQYFHNRFRNETVGVGGIFFDNLSTQPNPKLDIRGAATKRPKTTEECIEFFKSTGQAWSEAYIPILKLHMSTPGSTDDRTAQLIRRGHMIEHFMMVDMGFAFGLATDTGSMDAMRLILPETAQWKHTYNKMPKGKRAVSLVEVLKKPKSWV